MKDIIKYFFGFHKISGAILLISKTIFLGVLQRLFNMLSFVAIIKLFVYVIDPAKVHLLLDMLFKDLGFGLSIDRDLYFLIFIIIIFFIYIFAAVFSKLRWVFLERLQKANFDIFSLSDFCGDKKRESRILFSLLPKVTERYVAIYEVIVFYILIGSVVLLISPVVGLTIFLISPVFICLSIYRSKNENDEGLRESPKDKSEKFVLITSGQVKTASNRSFSEGIVGAFVLLVVSAYYFLNSKTQIEGFFVLLLVFGTRFMFGYLREISNAFVLIRMFHKEVSKIKMVKNF